MKKEKKVVKNFENAGLSFVKIIDFSEKCGIDVSYKFNRKNILKDYNFGIEFNISLLSPNDIFAKIGNEQIALSELKEFKEASSFILLDTFKKLTFNFTFDKARILSMPVYSVSSSESGFEKVYQSKPQFFYI